MARSIIRRRGPARETLLRKMRQGSPGLLERHERPFLDRLQSGMASISSRGAGFTGLAVLLLRVKSCSGRTVLWTRPSIRNTIDRSGSADLPTRRSRWNADSGPVRTSRSPRRDNWPRRRLCGRGRGDTGRVSRLRRRRRARLPVGCGRRSETTRNVRIDHHPDAERRGIRHQVP